MHWYIIFNNIVNYTFAIYKCINLNVNYNNDRSNERKVQQHQTNVKELKMKKITNHNDIKKKYFCK